MKVIIFLTFLALGLASPLANIESVKPRGTDDDFPSCKFLFSPNSSNAETDRHARTHARHIEREREREREREHMLT
jgi:hypothetical protein